MDHLLNLNVDWCGFEANPHHLYVYVDFTLDTNEPFYVGKGTATRVRARSQRNNKHGNTARKHGIVRKVVFNTMLDSEAFACEVKLIRENNTYLSDRGCNFTQGGDGATGYRFSLEARQAMSLNRKGRKLSADVIARAAESNRGQKRSAETRAKISARRKGQVTPLQRLALEKARASRRS